MTSVRIGLRSSACNFGNCEQVHMAVKVRNKKRIRHFAQSAFLKPAEYAYSATACGPVALPLSGCSCTMPLRATVRSGALPSASDRLKV